MPCSADEISMYIEFGRVGLRTDAYAAMKGFSVEKLVRHEMVTGLIFLPERCT